MKRVGTCKPAFIIFLVCCATVLVSAAQSSLTTLVNFNLSNGGNPFHVSLEQGLDGDLYGTTYSGGTQSGGTIFKITRTGTLTVLYNFCAQTKCADGQGPIAGLVLATDGNFYGTTTFGGTRNLGTVFRVSQNGALTALHSFCVDGTCADGVMPESLLVQASDGNLYGTTLGGGASGEGTVFRITRSGTLTTLYSFCAQSGCTDGASPYAGLVQAPDGDLYGTTTVGGNGYGTVFKITRGGALTTLYSFCIQKNCADGTHSYARLVLAADGNFYGTTLTGGVHSSGTAFKISPSGTLTTLYSFCAQPGCADGAEPVTELIQATDGKIYGTTHWGGTYNVCSPGCGTLFNLSSSGLLTSLTFGGVNGSDPEGGLVQATDGNFYGTTINGGTSRNCIAPMGCGTVFELAGRAVHFVKPLPYSGKVGLTIYVLGQGLGSTTGVSFNGVAANFSIKSDTYLTATVPRGATTGPVTVTTSSGVLLSNKDFRVMP